uniref:Uncharacterized protein n=1 Tax=Callorhinchus milii TaxID=7868 RepID=A0A4W3H775_CALMI
MHQNKVSRWAGMWFHMAGSLSHACVRSAVCLQKGHVSEESAEGVGNTAKLSQPHQMKPMSNRERNFVLKHHVFLVRNWEKIRQKQEEAKQETDNSQSATLYSRWNGICRDDGNIKSGTQRHGQAQAHMRVQAQAHMRVQAYSRTHTRT